MQSSPMGCSTFAFPFSDKRVGPSTATIAMHLCREGEPFLFSCFLIFWICFLIFINNSRLFYTNARFVIQLQKHMIHLT